MCEVLGFIIKILYKIFRINFYFIGKKNISTLQIFNIKYMYIFFSLDYNLLNNHFSRFICDK